MVISVSVARVLAPSRVAVTSTHQVFTCSDSVESLSDSPMVVGRGSSSRMGIRTPLTARPGSEFVARTARCSVSSYRASSTGVTVRAAVALYSPAGMDRVRVYQDAV